MYVYLYLYIDQGMLRINPLYIYIVYACDTHNTNRKGLFFILSRQIRKWDPSRSINLQLVFSLNVSWLSLIRLEEIKAQRGNMSPLGLGII